MKNPTLPPYSAVRTISYRWKNPASSPPTPSLPVDRATTSPLVDRATPAPSMTVLIVQLQLLRWRRRSRSSNPFDDGEDLLLHLASFLFLAPIIQLQLLLEIDNFFFVVLMIVVRVWIYKNQTFKRVCFSDLKLSKSIPFQGLSQRVSNGWGDEFVF
ncbi:hypothetical protein LWI28_001586 [Acer negundo]|uniref:Transmembrane protein n=1 Tax=Acer negundo TaxID=4023 RepID=A0AAD5JI37_ACENE|nr:hypothetical protein LWI28_001586 [Acer negundo]